MLLVRKDHNLFQDYREISQAVLSEEDIHLRNVYLSVLIPAILFLAFPFLGCIVSIFFSFILNKNNYVKFTFAYIYIFVILIQGQRHPIASESGDWNNYIQFYNEAGSSNIFGTFDGLKDIGYTLWNYIGHKIWGGNANSFLCFTLDIELLLYGISTYKVWYKTDFDARTGLCSIVMILMFSEIILISNNLLRQQFAISIVIFALVLKYSNNRLWSIFIIWGILTHSMTLLFVPLFFFKINQRLSSKLLLKTLIVVIILTLLYPILQSSLFGSAFYIFQRIGSATDYLSQDVIDPSVLIMFALIVFFIYFKHYLIDRTVNKYIWLGCNALLYITLICLITMNMPLVLTRIYIARLPLLSLVIPYLFLNRSIIKKFYQGAIICFFFLRFCFMSHGEYLDISKYALEPLINLI